MSSQARAGFFDNGPLNITGAPMLVEYLEAHPEAKAALAAWLCAGMLDLNVADPVGIQIALEPLATQPIPVPEGAEHGWHDDGDECTGPLCGNPDHFDDGPEFGS